MPAVQTVAIGLTKTPDPTTFDAAGTVITYTLTATNTGNVTLHAITVTDAMTGLTGPVCPTLTPGTTLAPGQSLTCTATYTTTQADLDGTGIVNTAIAEASSPQNTNTSDTATATVSPVQHPAISLVKTADPPDFSTAGTLITYSYKVTNTGNVTLTSIGVTDAMTGLSSISCPSSTLAPADSETCTATYTTTQADVDAGQHHQYRDCVRHPTDGAARGDAPHHLDRAGGRNQPGQVGQHPVLRSARPARDLQLPGDQHRQRHPHFGGRDRSDARPVGGHLPRRHAGPDRLGTCTATYTTTAADVQHGSITNVGTASGTPSVDGALGPPVTATSTVTIPGPKPAISLVKTASITSFSAAGTKVTYTYKVTNTGNVALTP